MTEQQSPSKIIPLRMTAPTAGVNFTNSVVSGVNAVQLSTGTLTLAAFNGTNASERIFITFRSEENFELMTSLLAATTKIDVYKSGQLVSNTLPLITPQSLGMIEKNVTYGMAITSTVLIAASTVFGSVFARQTPDLLYYVEEWKIDTIIPSISFSIDSTGAHVATFTNVSVTQGVKIDLVNYYNTLVNGSYNLQLTGDFISIYGTSTTANQQFNAGLNILWTFIPTYTGIISGTIKFNFIGLGTATNIPMTFGGYLGERKEELKNFQIRSYKRSPSVVLEIEEKEQKEIINDIVKELAQIKENDETIVTNGFKLSN